MAYSYDTYEIENCQDGKLEIQFASPKLLPGFEGRLSNILLHMIRGDPYVRPPSAARQVNRLFLEWTSDESHQDDSFLETLWKMVISLVEQIPHTHEAQRTMISLILELQKLRAEEGRIEKVSGASKKLRGLLY
jgi:hypothetical protein